MKMEGSQEDKKENEKYFLVEQKGSAAACAVGVVGSISVR